MVIMGAGSARFSLVSPGAAVEWLDQPINVTELVDKDLGQTPPCVVDRLVMRLHSHAAGQATACHGSGERGLERDQAQGCSARHRVVPHISRFHHSSTGVVGRRK